MSATPFRRVGDGEYRINDAVQTTLQAICPTPPCSADSATNSKLQAQRQAALGGLTNQEAQTLDIRHRRDVALLDASVAVFEHTNLLFHFQNTKKGGTQPWFASFGFNAANELAGPVEHRTTDVGAALEWSNAKGVVKVGWDGSWFQNDVSTLVWDNPIRATDFTYSSAYSPGDGTSQGRADLWPDTSMNMISGTATYKLPARTRAYANLGFSVLGNDDALLPHTINTAIPVIPLQRTDRRRIGRRHVAARRVWRPPVRPGVVQPALQAVRLGQHDAGSDHAAGLDDLPGHGVRALRPGRGGVRRRRGCGAILLHA